MKLITRTVAIVFILLAAFPLFAQTTVTIGSLSTYVVDNGDQPYNKPIAYVSAIQNLPSGFYVGLWGSTGTEGGRELDYQAGWSNKNLGVGVSYNMHAGGGPANVMQVDLRGAYPMKKGNHALEFFMMGSPVLPTNTNGDSGVLVRAGLNDNWAFSSNTELVQGAWVMYDSGIFKGERGFTVRYEMGIGLKYGGVVFTPLVRLSVPINMVDRKAHVIAGLRVGM